MSSDLPRVACLGNMNNNLFALARYLRDAGIEADLLRFDNEPPHFHPSADTLSDEWVSMTKELDWGSLVSFERLTGDQVAADLKAYDIVIGSGSAPAFLKKANRRVNIFIPYGSDISDLAFFRLRNHYLKWRQIRQRIYWHLRDYQMTNEQRAGLCEADHVILRPTYPYTGMLEKIGRQSPSVECDVPMLYLPAYSDDTLDVHQHRRAIYEEMRDIRERNDIVIFHHSRHCWQNPPDPFSNKRNDILLRGFAEFVQSNSDTKACLVTCAYGPDVNASKSLISGLGITDRVVWLEMMPRKDIMIALRFADFGSGEFQMGWQTGGTVSETLAMGKPIMHHRKDKLYEGMYPELYPHIDVTESEHVAASLSNFLNKPNHFREMGTQGKKWFEEHIIRHPLETIINLINIQRYGRATGDNLPRPRLS